MCYIRDNADCIAFGMVSHAIEGSRKMKTRLSVAVIIGLVMIGLAGHIEAYLSATLSIEKLVQESDVICTGEGISGFNKKAVWMSLLIGTRMKLTFHVNKVIKGDVDPGDDITIIFPSLKRDNYIGDPPARDEHSILFLKKRNGNYVYTKRDQGKLIVSTSENKVLKEKFNTAEEVVVAELINSAYDADPKVAFRAVSYLERGIEIPQERFLPHLKELSASRSTAPAIQGLALAMILKAKEYSYIEEALEYIENPPDGERVEFAKGDIARAFSKIRNPEMVSRLNTLLLKAKDEELRRAVAYSLREIEHKSSVPYLADGLNDQDQGVRYHCMMALAHIEGKFQDWAPGLDLFEANEEEYLSKWKQWWEEEGRQKYQKK